MQFKDITVVSYVQFSHVFCNYRLKDSLVSHENELLY